MANDVFADGREISCKCADGDSPAAFPDPCWTPPTTPASPTGVVVPYPNTGKAKDTTNGSKSVKITGKEVMLRDKSYFKKSYGDKSATRSLPMGFVSHTIEGKVYFISWSMDVKIEGYNVVRHLDATTHNHLSKQTSNTPPWPYKDTSAFANLPECEEDAKKAREACTDSTPDDCTDDCKKARACILVPKGKDKEQCCSPDNTGHHMIEDHWVKDVPGFPMAQGTSGYDAAPTVCVNAKRSEGNHQSMHNVQGVYEESYMPGGARRVEGHPSGGFTYTEGKKAALNAHDATFSDSKCARACIEAQLDDFYGSDPDRPLKKPERRQPIGEGPRAETLEHWGPSIDAAP